MRYLEESPVEIAKNLIAVGTGTQELPVTELGSNVGRVRDLGEVFRPSMGVACPILLPVWGTLPYKSALLSPFMHHSMPCHSP